MAGRKAGVLNALKKLSHFFLFQYLPAPRLPWWQRALFWVWNLGLVTAASAALGLLALPLATGPYPGEFARSCYELPGLLALNLLPCLLLMLLFYGAIGRAHWAFLASAAVVLGFSLGNYYKLTFRDDPLMFADLLLLREAGAMAGKYKLFMDWTIGAALLEALGCWLLLFLLARGRPRWQMRTASALLAAAAAAGLSGVYLDGPTYTEHTADYQYLDSSWSSTQQYIAHGFLYPFLHSISEAIEVPPEGYSREAAAEVLSRYEDGDIPEEQKVNIVAVMLEAYNDFTRLGAPDVNPDVYLFWHMLEAEGYSGNLVTNIFAGGTVDTERSFLTGCSTLPALRSNTNSYVWYFRSQGYTVEGMHPSSEWFYNRVNVNEYLGFERYLFAENCFQELTGEDTAMDDVFFPELIRRYEEGTAGGKPYFNFSVTYQGHGPYDTDASWWGEPEVFLRDADAYTEEQRNIMANYFGSLTYTGKYLKELRDYFLADTKPVILVLFGDHNPWLGDGNSVYDALDAEFSMLTQEGFLNYYTTRYIIWANAAAKKALGCDFRGEGPDIGPYFLMNELFKLCGWDGPAFMQAATDAMERVPVIHAADLYLENGTLTTEPSKRGARLVRDYLIAQYDWRHRFLYK